MQHLFIKLLTANNIVDALCRTLFHSLWQGFILAFVAGIIILLTRKSNPVIRYNLLAGALVLFLDVALFTFIRELDQPAATQHALSFVAGNYESPISSLQGNDSSSLISAGSRISGFLDKYAVLIVAIWMIMLVFRAIRFMGGLFEIQQLRSRKINLPAESWMERLKALSVEMGIYQTVQLFESGITKVPVVLGHLKPIILFPIGLLNSLPADEVEAILVHELAHVRRKDYLVNVLQSIAEVFFFFNPGLLWVSSLIRHERENCCDDIAVQITNSKGKYIQALLSFQEFNLGAGRLTPALAGRKYMLLERVRRIIYNNNKTLNAMEKFFLGSGLVIASILALDYSPHQKTLNAGNKPVVQAISSRDTVPEPDKGQLKELESANINTMVDGKKYELHLKEGKVTELLVDGQKIPNEKIGDYEVITSKIIRDANENLQRDKIEAGKARQMSDRSREQEMKARTEEGEAQRLLEKLKQEQDGMQQKEMGERERDNLSLLKQELRNQKEMNDRERKQELSYQKRDLEREILSRKRALENNSMLREKGTLDKIREERVMDKIREDREMDEVREEREVNEQVEKKEMIELQERINMLSREKDRTGREEGRSNDLRERAVRAKEQAMDLRRQAENSERMARQLEQEATIAEKMNRQDQNRDQNLMDRLLDDLMKEKVISSKKNVSVNFTDDALIVNGVKQPDQLFQKLKAKYFMDEKGRNKAKVNL